MSDVVDQSQTEIESTVAAGVQAAAEAASEEQCPQGDQAPAAPPGESKADSDFRRRLDEATIDLRECAIAVSRLDAGLKAAKVSLKAAVDTVQRLCARGPETLPLFDRATTVPGAAEAVASPPEQPADEWRCVAIEGNLELPKGLIGKLEVADIVTLGELVDAQGGQDGRHKGLRDIKGVGKAAVDKIEDAIEAYFRDNPQRPAVESEPAGNPDWEDLDLAALVAAGLPQDIADHLTAAGLLTVGAIEEYLEEKSYREINNMGQQAGGVLQTFLVKLLDEFESEPEESLVGFPDPDEVPA